MHIPVRIVLVETTHPGNIGAAARAMRTMGLDDLALVAPRDFPSHEATARSSGASDLLERARVVASLPEAIAECSFIVGTSARSRAVEWPLIDPRECAARLWNAIDSGNTPAIVFGPEHSGLTNEALARCHAHVRIPTDETFSSLNLAMAVQVLSYELRMAALARSTSEASAVADSGVAATEAVATGAFATGPAAMDAQARASGRHRLATSAELEGFHEHLERVLVAAEFLRDDHPRQLKLKLRRVFSRAALDRNEVDILRGVLTSLDPTRSRRRSG